MSGDRLRVTPVDDSNRRFADAPGVRTVEGDEAARQQKLRLVRTPELEEGLRPQITRVGKKTAELTELDWLLNGVGPKPDFSN